MIDSEKRLNTDDIDSSACLIGDAAWGRAAAAGPAVKGVLELRENVDELEAVVTKMKMMSCLNHIVFWSVHSSQCLYV